MRYNTILAWFALFMLVVSCGTKSTKEKQQEGKDVGQDEVTVKLVKGILIIGDEGSSFRACNDSLDYWVEDETNQLDSLYYKEVEYDLETYIPVYAELVVIDRGEGAGGYAEAYESIYEVKEVRVLRRWNEESDCQ
ncbi:MAG: hypothetical protein GX963_07485 [Bacteroidales bacterium]|nr:hypothetical protein [Bacteroidales bacterium]